VFRSLRVDPMVYSVASGIPRGMGVSGYVVAKGLRYGVVKFNLNTFKTG